MGTKTDHVVTPDKVLATNFVSVDLKRDDQGEYSNDLDSNSINFRNHAAFAGKRAWEIARALCVLKMCSVNVFVENSLSVMKWTRRLLGSTGLKVLFKPMFYKQFVGGETHREIQECMKRVTDSGIRPMLAAAMEDDIGEEVKDEDIHDSNCTRILECMELSAAEASPSPMIQLKMTGLMTADCLVALSNGYSRSEDKLGLIKATARALTDEDVQAELFSNMLDEKKLILFKNALGRLKQIGEEAEARGVKILVDAEYTYLNPGLSLLTLAMASIYNQNAPLIWNTYQCYLKDAHSKLREELSIIENLGVYFGAKLVRGAYIVQERLRARKLQIQDPVCKDYEAVSDNYHTILEFLLDKTRTIWPKCSFMVASHNEDTIKLAIQKMKDAEIENQNENVCFGQLYGMSDNITYPLAISGYAVYKSIPYGTVDEVLPYLARRAIENKSVLSGTRKEQILLWKEMKRRLRPNIRQRSSS